MSSALVRQALEFVDQDNQDQKKSGAKRSKKGASKLGHDITSQKRSNSKSKKKQKLNTGTDIDEKIKRLLKLSEKVVEETLSEKIVQRAVKGKPLSDFIEVKDEAEPESIFFPGESWKDFEKNLFCS